MENTEDDDDLRLFKALAVLLADLEDALPKLLWKSARSGQGRKVHTQVKRRDLDHVINLIEPFQSDPQLLDASLKHILPPIVEAYLAYIREPLSKKHSEHIDLETAVCCLLYVLCKVRGYKVILGFLSNEPQYLEPVLLRLEHAASAEQDQNSSWQVPYMLLLWLSHLLLTPFDLASISSPLAEGLQFDDQGWPQGLPAVTLRLLNIALGYLPTSTKAQDSASMLLVRLVKRPDMQEHSLGNSLAVRMLKSLQASDTDTAVTVYERLGPLRLLSGIAASSELSHLVPDIYKVCQLLSEDVNSFVATNAVAKKLVIKIFRDVATLSLRSQENANGALLSFFETNSVLEDVIDYLLRALGDRDTPVRFAAAKAISLIVLQLEQEMREEVIQAVLDTFKEDMPRSAGQALDFRTANALRWHGLTLCLAHTLFKRSASPTQLPDIVVALVSALQFEQRTATGSTVGTNVRDAANFGIWSLSRRYTTQELQAVETSSIRGMSETTIIQHLAIELVLSACLDPAGNVRRGSSAALQELIGRHPNQVKEGISLVQTVDYQAVGLRSRAIVEVSVRATDLDSVYFGPVRKALMDWRGLGSPDVSSREAAALSLARLAEQGVNQVFQVVNEVMQRARTTDARERELFHGLTSTMAIIFEKASVVKQGPRSSDPALSTMRNDFPALLAKLDLDDFSSRLLRSELPSAIAKMLAEYCACSVTQMDPDNSSESELQPTIDFEKIETLTERLLARGEENIREVVPPLARSLFALKRRCRVPLECLGSQALTKQVAIDGAKSILNGAGRAVALGALAPMYSKDMGVSRLRVIVATLGSLTQAMNVDWRIIGIRALQLAVEGGAEGDEIEEDDLEYVVQAVHRGLNDYTIDERGDVGSLVRLQAISCTSSVFSVSSAGGNTLDSEPLRILQADILRLSLEKLDRVRLAAAQCQSQHLALQTASRALDTASVSSYEYFEQQFQPLSMPGELDWKYSAILEGAISAAGISSKQLLQASRSALANVLDSTTTEHLSHLMTLYTTILKTSLASPTSPLTTPALTLLAYLLDMRIPQQRLPSPPFKWLNLLSAVQKSHHKSNDIPKIASAVAVYRGIAEVGSLRVEVLRKLLGMLRTNPYPRIRGLVAEVVFVVVGDGEGEVVEVLKKGDWMGERKVNEGAMRRLEEILLGPT